MPDHSRNPTRVARHVTLSIMATGRTPPQHIAFLDTAGIGKIEYDVSLIALGVELPTMSWALMLWDAIEIEPKRTLAVVGVRSVFDIARVTIHRALMFRGDQVAVLATRLPRHDEVSETSLCALPVESVVRVDYAFPRYQSRTSTFRINLRSKRGWPDHVYSDGMVVDPFMSDAGLRSSEIHVLREEKLSTSRFATYLLRKAETLSPRGLVDVSDIEHRLHGLGHYAEFNSIVDELELKWDRGRRRS